MECSNGSSNYSFLRVSNRDRVARLIFRLNQNVPSPLNALRGIFPQSALLDRNTRYCYFAVKDTRFSLYCFQNENARNFLAETLSVITYYQIIVASGPRYLVEVNASVVVLSFSFRRIVIKSSVTEPCCFPKAKLVYRLRVQQPFHKSLTAKSR